MKVRKIVLIWLKHVRFIRAWTTVTLPQTILAINYPELWFNQVENCRK